MVDWQSPKVILKSAFYFDHSLSFMLGLYLWEYLLTFINVEWQLIRRRLKFRPILLAYFLGRYLWLSSLIAIVIVVRTSGRQDCAFVSRLFGILGTFTTVCASMNLFLRTLLIWRDNRYVVILLLLGQLGHWIMAIVGGVRGGHAAYWDPSIRSCHFSPKALIPLYAYTTLFDLLVCVLTIAGLYRHHVLNTGSLWMRVCNQGVLYFVATVLVNVPLLAFASLNLNAVMALICSVPGMSLRDVHPGMKARKSKQTFFQTAVTLSIIFSSRAVISLLSCNTHSGRPLSSSDDDTPVNKNRGGDGERVRAREGDTDSGGSRDRGGTSVEKTSFGGFTTNIELEAEYVFRIRFVCGTKQVHTAITDPPGPIPMS
ncbi:hypothetical protein K474DRAFT_1077844 [Panus rudis PR-1116 ss-1]|nr:hypothetical protein K474DRAFT_1077844 [Panus rudis PR-1116 ss-1]